MFLFLLSVLYSLCLKLRLMSLTKANAAKIAAVLFITVTSRFKKVYKYCKMRKSKYCILFCLCNIPSEAVLQGHIYVSRTEKGLKSLPLHLFYCTFDVQHENTSCYA